MAVRIFNNIASSNAQRLLGANHDRLNQSVERISSGIRINRASDDAAGLRFQKACAPTFAPFDKPVGTQTMGFHSSTLLKEH